MPDEQPVMRIDLGGVTRWFGPLLLMLGVVCRVRVQLSIVLFADPVVRADPDFEKVDIAMDVRWHWTARPGEVTQPS